jgi:hypothetical protein
MKEIFKQAGWGATKEERGAIIYLGGGGKLWAHEVPWSHGYRQQSIPLTETTLATAHTHPTSGADYPIGKDPGMGEAKRVLMYVLHRRGVVVYVPWIRRNIRVLRGTWWR